MSPEVPRAAQGTVAGSGAAVPRGGGGRAPDLGVAGPDLPAAVVALIRREAFVFDAVGSPIARPPVDIRCRLRLFHKVSVSLEEIVGVLRSGRSRPS
jgi:hypothetical protein